VSVLAAPRLRGKPGRRLALVIALAVVMTVLGAVIGRYHPPSDPDPAAAGPGSAALSALLAPPVLDAAGGSKALSSLQERLRTLPDDWNSWANLGLLYTAQARLTADPSFYAKADGAFAASLRLHPDDNAAATTGKATLAASRHDFTGALALTQAADGANAYSAPNLGVMTDALIELGRYPEAFESLQRMVDLKPGVASYTRVSYAYELRGDLEGARFALDRALVVATNPADIAFVQQYLGELAFNSGDLATASQHVTAGLAVAPDYVPLLAGRARVEAAQGQTEAALKDWALVTTRLPQPTYLIEYADLLTALGRTQDADAQYALVAATAALYRAAGANVDLELSLYDADHSRGQDALRAAQTQIDQRHSSAVEDAYAWALHAVGRDAEALPHATAAAALGMKNALFAYHRGMIEKALGHDAEAKTSLGTAMTQNPHFSPLQAPAAQAALDELTKKGS